MTKTVHACAQCIREPFVHAEIRRTGTHARCYFCGKARRWTVPLGWLADRLDPVYRSVIGPAREDLTLAGGEMCWRTLGQPASAIATSLFRSADQRLGSMLVDLLAKRHAAGTGNDSFDFYGDPAGRYEILDGEGSDLNRRWDRFCTAVKQERRFFNEAGAALIDEILRPLLNGDWPAGDAIRTIGPGDPDRFIYRGRTANSVHESAAILRQPINQLAAPGPGQASAGRMNAAGISVFYGAFDADTCVAELRAPVGGSTLVGKFEIIRPLRVLDLARLELVKRHLSYFEPGYAQLRSYASFIAGFHDQVRRAVVPGRETLDYLPTQIVAEFLWSVIEPPFDGLVFGSAQVPETGRNIVLFPHAVAVEGASEETEREIEHSYTLEGAGGVTEERVLLSRLDAGILTRARRQRERWRRRWFDPLAHDPEPLAATLRFVDSGVLRMQIESIQYGTRSVRVKFDDAHDHDGL